MITVPRRIDLIRMQGPSVGCEVGVWRGYFSIEILNHTNVEHLYLVDAWKPQPAYNDPLTDTDHEANLAECRHHLRGHVKRFTIVRGDSLDVAANNKTIPPLDWAYIDGNHSFEACYADLVAWSKRLAPGGVMMGHDHTDVHPNAIKWNFGVVKAVSKFCEDFGWTLTHLTAEDFPSYCLARK